MSDKENSNINNHKPRPAEKSSANRKHSLKESQWMSLFKIDIDNQARDLIKNEIPRQIEELTVFLSSRLFVDLGVTRDHGEPESKEKLPQAVLASVPPAPSAKPGRPRKRSYPEETEPAQPQVRAAARDDWLMKPALETVVKNVTAILIEAENNAKLFRMWITLFLPKIEDGNNFGVAVQESLIMTTAIMEMEAKHQLQYLLDYFINRAAQIVSQSDAKSVEDLAVTIREHDALHAHAVYITVRDVRDNYAIALDHLLKNIEKIKRPKSNNFTDMY